MTPQSYYCNNCKDTGTYFGGEYGTKEVKCRNCNQIKRKYDMANEFEVVCVKSLPQKKDQKYGIIYITVDHENTVHQCPCGCGYEVYLNHDLDRKRGWVISVINDKISIDPSIGNTFPCRTHYYITENKIKWC